MAGKHVVFANFRGRAQKIAGDDQLHESLDLHAYRAVVRARRLGTLQATQRFLSRQFGRIAQVHFGEVGGAQLCRLFRHVLPRELSCAL